MEIVVSEKERNARYIAYVYTSLMPYIEACGAKSSLTFGGERIGLTLRADKKYESYLRRFAEEKIAETVAVGYKYEIFRRELHPAGLNAEEREILFAALVAADFADDKRYVFARLRGASVYSVDGFFAFRLGALLRKWKGIVGCVPPYFTREKLSAFMRYLLREDAGEKVIVRGADIFDGKYHKLRRATLIEEGATDMNAIREIILSGAGEVECVGVPPPGQEKFLRDYFAGKVSFM